MLSRKLVIASVAVVLLASTVSTAPVEDKEPEENDFEAEEGEEELSEEEEDDDDSKGQHMKGAGSHTVTAAPKGLGGMTPLPGSSVVGKSPNGVAGGAGANGGSGSKVPVSSGQGSSGHISPGHVSSMSSSHAFDRPSAGQTSGGVGVVSSEVQSQPSDPLDGGPSAPHSGGPGDPLDGGPSAPHSGGPGDPLDGGPFAPHSVGPGDPSMVAPLLLTPVVLETPLMEAPLLRTPVVLETPSMVAPLLLTPVVLETPLMEAPLLLAPVVLETPSMVAPLLLTPVVLETPLMEAPLLLAPVVLETPSMVAPLLLTPVVLETPLMEAPLLLAPVVLETPSMEAPLLLAPVDPLNGGPSAPCSGGHRVPLDGGHSTPSSGSHRDPLDGGPSAPSSGSRRDPLYRGPSAPSSGGSVDPLDRGPSASRSNSSVSSGQGSSGHISPGHVSSMLSSHAFDRPSAGQTSGGVGVVSSEVQSQPSGSLSAHTDGSQYENGEMAEGSQIEPPEIPETESNGNGHKQLMNGGDTGFTGLDHFIEGTSQIQGTGGFDSFGASPHLEMTGIIDQSSHDFLTGLMGGMDDSFGADTQTDGLDHMGLAFHVESTDDCCDDVPRYFSFPALGLGPGHPSSGDLVKAALPDSLGPDHPSVANGNGDFPHSINSLGPDHPSVANGNGDFPHSINSLGPDHPSVANGNGDFPHSISTSDNGVLSSSLADTTDSSFFDTMTNMDHSLIGYSDRGMDNGRDSPDMNGNGRHKPVAAVHKGMIEHP
ncbi:mucin-4-like [Xyrauchen texanus]|uniref:mucin-4-like n=1 Tax=Xyrauchen texanus TaxID=154827 RepID=UPI0022428C46|nr:mucin-4-like [Xyrauchen texanus]